MLHTTKGLVIRTVRYGETSVIVTIFTAMFGMRSYLVNGVRTSKAKNAFTPGMFQPAALLEITVYEQQNKNLQRIRESRWAVLYQHIFSDMHKNAVALYMIELLQKCLRQPEPHPELFYFAEDAFNELDQSSAIVTANFPLYFTIHLALFFGFRLEDEYSGKRYLLDLKEGNFVSETPDHPFWVGLPQSEHIADFLKTQHPADTANILLNRDQRNQLLSTCLQYYALHYPDFGTLKSLQVLQTIFG